MTSHDDHRPEVEQLAQGQPGEDQHGQERPGEDRHGAPQEAPAADWEGLNPLSVWANTALVSLFMVPSAIVATVLLVFVEVSSLWALLPLPAVLAFIGLMTYVEMLRLRATR
jgi:putative membrane protein